MNTPSLRVAAAQFPVSGDADRNLAYIGRHVATAAARGADVVHFPESALCGYAPRHLPTLEAYPWQRLQERTAQVQELAGSLGVWVVLGSMGARPDGLPRNTTLVIGRTGELVATYAKRRLYGPEAAAYSPGDAPVVVEIEGIRCGFLICYENCFPSLYAEYRQLGVEVLFHSFYNARNSRPTSIRHLMRATLLVRAADHGMHISASNSCEPFCPLPAGIVRPDGSSVWARRHVSGVVLDDCPCADLGWTYEPEP